MLFLLPMEVFHGFFYDPVLDGAVIYTRDVPFQYDEQQGMYTEFSGNPAGNIFLAASRGHELYISHKSNMLHISNNLIEPTNLNFVENSINIVKISPIPSGLLHPTHVIQQIYVHNLHASYGPIAHMAVSNYCL